jgi:hypothetical protein
MEERELVHHPVHHSLPVRDGEKREDGWRKNRGFREDHHFLYVHCK